MEKQMKKSLSRQMTAVFVGLLAFVLAAVFIVNAVFLGHYYTTHKESDLLNTYNALKEAQESDELTDENKQWKLSYELEKMNIDVCVMNVDRDAGTINEIFSNVKEKSLLYDQTLRIFFSKDTGNETVLKSTDQYVMRKMTDRQNGTDYLEMWGYLGKCFSGESVPDLSWYHRDGSWRPACMDFFKKDHQAGDGIGKAVGRYGESEF